MEKLISILNFNIKKRIVIGLGTLLMIWNIVYKGRRDEMRKNKALTYEELKITHDFSKWSHAEKEEMEIIGQDRAIKAMHFGLKIKAQGYNIYMSGPTGTGKTSYAKKVTSLIAKEESTPWEWCYVYNFHDASRPQALSFPAGHGKKFKNDMEELIQILSIELLKTFHEESYEKEKNELIKTYQEQSETFLKIIKDRAHELGFHIKISNAGAYFIPLVDGEKITEAQYDTLPEEKKEEIMQNSDLLQEESEQVIKKIQEIEKDLKNKIEQLDYKIGLEVVGHHMTPLQRKYQDNEKVFNYLKCVKEDILENLYQFTHAEEEEEEDGLTSVLPWLTKTGKEEFRLKYAVNLLVDHTKTQGAPVIIDFNPTFYNLLGKIEYENEFGNLKTDFTKIHPGLFHEANGGYLILQIQDVLSNPQAWELIKRVLKTKEVSIENLREQLLGVAVSSLKPEPIPLTMKVILIGNPSLYHLLYEYDEDFKKLFKIRADFDTRMVKTDTSVRQLVTFIHQFSEEQGLKKFHVSALEKIIEYASRLAESRNKLTTRFNQIVEILYESNAWAQMDQSDEVCSIHVKKAIREKAQRSNLYEEKMEEMIEEQMLMIETSGSYIGQINGLAVLDGGDYIFAKPTRITATTYMGKAGIINIEKESNLSGRVHTKGVQVLSGYLGQTYAQEFPLSLSCQICFEQSYYGIDGDSASTAELYAILSSLAEIPIDQGIAVTGSLNQRGEIQPIGGVTHKIEGFFKLCQQRGLTGNQGVLIPKQNVQELVLKEEVMEAIAQGQFHIYPITHVDEGIEVLMEIPAQEVHQQVSKKLKGFYERSIVKKEGKC